MTTKCRHGCGDGISPSARNSPSSPSPTKTRQSPNTTYVYSTYHVPVPHSLFFWSPTDESENRKFSLF